MRERTASTVAAEVGEKAAVAPTTAAPEQGKVEEPRPRGDQNRVTFDQGYQPKPLKYNVVTPPVPLWKLSSVANFKRRVYLQNIQEQQRRAAASETTELSASEGEAGNNSKGGAGIGGSTRVARSVTRQMMNEAAAASASGSASEQEMASSGNGGNSTSGYPMGGPAPPEG